MKGIVFNLLEEVVSREYGDDMWDNLLDRLDSDGAYTSLGSYGDDEVIKLVDAASAATGKPAKTILQWFGRHAIPMLAGRFCPFSSPARVHSPSF